MFSMYHEKTTSGSKDCSFDARRKGAPYSGRRSNPCQATADPRPRGSARRLAAHHHKPAAWRFGPRSEEECAGRWASCARARATCPSPCTFLLRARAKPPRGRFVVVGGEAAGGSSGPRIGGSLTRVGSPAAVRRAFATGIERTIFRPGCCFFVIHRKQHECLPHRTTD